MEKSPIWCLKYSAQNDDFSKRFALEIFLMQRLGLSTGSGHKWLVWNNFLCPRMGLFVNFPKSFGSDVGVYLRGGKVFMSEQFFYGEEVGTGIK